VLVSLVDPVLKVYLSVPMVVNRSMDRAILIARTIRDAGHIVSSPWVLGPPELGSATTTDVFQRDKTGAETCDVLVADVSQPSIGVGMEIMAAYNAGRRIVLLQRRGAVTSNMLRHMDRGRFVEFDDDSSLVAGLLDALRTA
jgi:hypothetical protein